MVIELKMFVSGEKITQKYIWNCVKILWNAKPPP